MVHGLLQSNARISLEMSGNITNLFSWMKKEL